MENFGLGNIRLRPQRYPVVLIAIAAVLWFSDDGRTQEKIQVPAAVAGSLDYLLALTEPDKEVAIEWRQVAELVEF